MKKNMIYGLHPVIEAIKSNQHIDKIFVQKGLKGQTFFELKALLDEAFISIKTVPIEKLNRLTRENHQGVVAFISPVKIYKPEDLIEENNDKDEQIYILLDGVTDPRNFGAIIRSAAATNVTGIIIPENNSAPINEDVVKTSAGGIFKIPIARTKHLIDAIFLLKSYNIKIFAATEKSDSLIYNKNLKENFALVMGSEGKGIQKNILKQCDDGFKLPMSDKMQSLNVAVATGVILYETVRQRLI